MFEKFMGGILAHASDEFLRLLFRSVLQEWVIWRRGKGLEAATEEFRMIIESLDSEHIDVDEKNLQLGNAGRDFIKRMHK